MPTGYCLPGALSFACVLLVATVAPVSTRPLSDVTCEGGWTSLAGVCWMAVPSLIFTEGGELAQTFCRMQDSKLFFSDAAALCFKTGDSNYGSLSPMETAIRKRGKISRDLESFSCHTAPPVSITRAEMAPVIDATGYNSCT